jgi:uncharacterized membrane protein YjfL (UPF0719 family)
MAIYWDHYYDTLIIVNLLIVVALFTCLRFFSGAISHINASDELLKKDNPAFGISLAGAAFAVTIMLSGTLYGDLDSSLISAAITVGLFGIIGIIMMAFTRLVFDKITLPKVHLRNEIIKGNKSVAIADAGNVIAAAIIIRATMNWVTVYSISGITALVGAYLISQFILTMITFLSMKTFKIINKDACIQEQLKKDNIAMALRFAGQKIGTAFAIAMAAQIVIYDDFDVITVLFVWFFASLAVIALWKVICFIAEHIILFRVDIYKEIIQQKNIAVGALTGIIYIALGLLISQL